MILMQIHPRNIGSDCLPLAHDLPFTTSEVLDSILEEVYANDGGSRQGLAIDPP